MRLAQLNEPIGWQRNKFGLLVPGVRVRRPKLPILPGLIPLPDDSGWVRIPLQAAIARVTGQFAGTSNASATSVAVAFPSNVTAGSCIVGFWRYGTNGRTVTLSDTQTNTYTSNAASGSDASDGNSTCGIGFALNCAGGATTVTFGISGAAANLRFIITEYSGVATSAALDQAIGGSGAATGTATVGNITPTSDGQLIVCGYHNSTASGMAAGTDFAMITTVGGDRLGAEDFVQTTAAAHNTDMTTGGTWSGAAITLKPPGAGGPTGPPPGTWAQMGVGI